MTLTNNIKLNMGNELKLLPDYQEIIRAVQTGVGKVMERAPSDSAMTVDVSRADNYFQVNMQLASMGLRFMLDAKARSPFVALDRAIAQAWDKVKLWSINRK